MRARTVAPLDIRDSAAVDRALAEVRERHGRLDAVICTPSINVRKKILDYSDEELDRVLALNIKGNFNVLRAAGRIMTADRRGSIVLFSSIRSQVVEPGQSVYAATKAGILQMARTAAAEFGPFGVRVNAVAPGVIETPLTAPIKANEAWYKAYADKTVFKRWGRAEEMVGPDAVSRLRRGQLCHRDAARRRRRLARGRRPIHAAWHVIAHVHPRRRRRSHLRRPCARLKRNSHRMVG